MIRYQQHSLAACRAGGQTLPLPILGASGPGQNCELVLGSLPPTLLDGLATSSMPQEAVKEKGKHYTALLLHIFLDPLSPLPPPPLTEKLVIPFELQIYLLHIITCYIISYQTIKNK